MGSPFLRWLRRLRPDPLRRLHLDRGPTRPTAGSSVPARTSVPEPSAVQRSRVDQALRALADHAPRGCPHPWPDAVRGAARSRSADLSDAAGPGGRRHRPRGDREAGLVAGARRAAGAAGDGRDRRRAVAGRALRADRAAAARPGHADGRPRCRCPPCCCSAGCWLGLLLALLARLLAALRAGRQAARAEARLRAAVAEVADELVVTPIRAELAAYEALRAALARLRPSGQA